MENWILGCIVSYFIGYKVSKYANIGVFDFNWSDLALLMVISLLIIRLISSKA